MNPPSAPFAAPYAVVLTINLDDCADDLRRIQAEHWCCKRTKGRWFRSVDKRYGNVSFEFSDQQEAALFRLFKG